METVTAMPNVKAGDLAIVKSDKPHYNGRIVEILAPAPGGGGFHLPDGTWHLPVNAHPSWIIKAIGAPLRAHFDSGEDRLVWYGVGCDSRLFPLPGEPEESEVESPATVRTEP